MTRDRGKSSSSARVGESVRQWLAMLRNNEELWLALIHFFLSELCLGGKHDVHELIFVFDLFKFIFKIIFVFVLLYCQVERLLNASLASWHNLGIL